ncbi:hypothetical protein C8J57DRAFT_1517409 [Mycena rebaudengoi]|nr:hypothetical protein C8J57DRAFT_1517409 [Mycena rebaudengoi]
MRLPSTARAVHAPPLAAPAGAATASSSAGAGASAPPATHCPSTIARRQVVSRNPKGKEGKRTKVIRPHSLPLVGYTNPTVVPSWRMRTLRHLAHVLLKLVLHA